MDMVLEVAAGAGVGAVAGELLKISMDVMETTSNYATELERLTTTVEHISERVKTITDVNDKLGLPHEMEGLSTLLEEGKEIVTYCSNNDSLWNRLSNSEQLIELDDALQKYFLTNLPLDQFMETKKIRQDIKELKEAIIKDIRQVLSDNRDEYMKNINHASWVSSTEGVDWQRWGPVLKRASDLAKEMGLHHLMNDIQNVQGNINSYDISVMKLNSTGYHAPEIIKTGKATQKSDVFSYGILLLEILTGQDPAMHNLPKRVLSMILKGKACDVLDVKLLQHQNAEEDMLEMLKVLEIAMLCVANNPNKRPTMGDVVRMMENIPTIS